MTRRKKNSYHNKGNVLLLTLLFSTVTMFFISALTNLTVVNVKSITKRYELETAGQIAEAGINYYRWHLTHDPLDFKDGTVDPITKPEGDPPPYIHPMKVTDAGVEKTVGYFSLDILPDPAGTGKLTITSSGTLCHPDTPGACTKTAKKTSRAVMIIPSFTAYGLIANSNLFIPQGTEIFGPVHSNNGIRFDGTAYNTVTSAVTSFQDPTSPAPATDRDGIYTTNSANESAVFKVGKKFGTNTIPFIGLGGILANLTELKTESLTANGFYMGECTGSGTCEGYHADLRTNGTFLLYKVKKTVTDGNCKKLDTSTTAEIWSIKTGQEEFIPEPTPGAHNLPANGIMFFEDNVWVDGTIQNKRITIVAADMRASPVLKNIIINGDITYSNGNKGKEAIGLIAQNNVLIPLKSPNTLKIDAALMAQNGYVGREPYDGNCGPEQLRDKLTIYGAITTSGPLGFTYYSADGNTFESGYAQVAITYDQNLLSAPPPKFPKPNTDQYTMLSWEQF